MSSVGHLWLLVGKLQLYFLTRDAGGLTHILVDACIGPHTLTPFCLSLANSLVSSQVCPCFSDLVWCPRSFFSTLLSVV